MDLITPYISRLLGNESPIVIAYGLLILAFFFRVNYLLVGIGKKLNGHVEETTKEKKKTRQHVKLLWRQVYGGDPPELE